MKLETNRPGFSRGFLVTIAVIAALACVVFLSGLEFSDLYGAVSRAFSCPERWIVLAVLPVIYVLQASVLAWNRTLTTSSARWLMLSVLDLLFLAYFALPSFLPSAGRGPSNLEDIVLGSLVYLVFLVFWMPGFFVYSVPTTWPGTFPLLLHYVILALFLLQGGLGRPAEREWGDLFPMFTGYTPALFFACVPLAGYWFPRHRRMVEYMRPARLPRLPSAAGR